MEEVPLLRRLSAKYSRTARMIGVAIDEEIVRIDRVVTEKKMTWPIVADGRGFEGPIPAAYHVQGTPDIFIIDADGRIVKRLGSATEVEAIVDGLVAARR